MNVWASSYDRQLTDVFAIQEDIATAIAGALRMPLGLKSGEHLVADRTVEQETYELYLRGRAALRTRNRKELDLLEEVARRDPNFWRSGFRAGQLSHPRKENREREAQRVGGERPIIPA